MIGDPHVGKVTDTANHFLPFFYVLRRGGMGGYCELTEVLTACR